MLIQPYCAHWLNDACKVPDKSYYDTSFTVDTYTIVEPLDIFLKYSNKACPSAPSLTLPNYSPNDCAKACLNSDTCTAFEMYYNTCKLRTSDGCATVDDLYNSAGTNTYFPIDLNSGNTFSYYFTIMVAGAFIVIVGLCCCACAKRNQLHNQLRDRTQHRCCSGQRANAVISILAARDVTSPDPESNKATVGSPVYTATITTPTVATTTYCVQGSVSKSPVYKVKTTDYVQGSVPKSPVYTATIAPNDVTYPSISQSAKMEV